MPTPPGKGITRFLRSHRPVVHKRARATRQRPKRPIMLGKNLRPAQHSSSGRARKGNLINITTSGLARDRRLGQSSNLIDFSKKMVEVRVNEIAELCSRVLSKLELAVPILEDLRSSLAIGSRSTFTKPRRVSRSRPNLVGR